MAVMKMSAILGGLVWGLFCLAMVLILRVGLEVTLSKAILFSMIASFLAMGMACLWFFASDLSDRLDLDKDGPPGTKPFKGHLCMFCGNVLDEDEECGCRYTRSGDGAKWEEVILEPGEELSLEFSDGTITWINPPRPPLPEDTN